MYIYKIPVHLTFRTFYFIVIMAVKEEINLHKQTINSLIVAVKFKIDINHP